VFRFKSLERQKLMILPTYSPYGGRNWENWSPDPYLSAVLTGKKVRGMQVGGVQATTKHFVGNEQEYLRIVSQLWSTERIGR
jgi:hypothetical protein